MEEKVLTTYTQLINDPMFLDKRIQEQRVYIREVINRFWRRELSVERYTELLHSAMPVLDRFKQQRKLINDRTKVQGSPGENPIMG